MSKLDKPLVSAEGFSRAETVQAVRRASSDVGEKSSAHKLILPDSVFTRLELHAIKRGTTASANAAEILDRQLPKFAVKPPASAVGI
jgi:hypothetical protein